MQITISDCDSPDNENSGLDSGVCQNRNLEPNLWFVLSGGDSLDCETMKPLPDFCGFWV